MKPKRKPKPLTPSERTKAWRAKNREHYNAYMREHRAKRRKEAKK